MYTLGLPAPLPAWVLERAGWRLKTGRALAASDPTLSGTLSLSPSFLGTLTSYCVIWGHQVGGIVETAARRPRLTLRAVITVISGDALTLRPSVSGTQVCL